MAQLEILSLYNYEQIPLHRKYVQKHLCAKMLGSCFFLFFFNIYNWWQLVVENAGLHAVLLKTM